MEITEFALRKSLITHRLRIKETLVSNQRPKLLLSSQFQVRADGEIRLTDRYQSGKTDEALSEFQLKAMPNSELITLSILEENRRMKDFRRFFITFTMKKLSRGETFVLKYLPFLGRFL